MSPGFTEKKRMSHDIFSILSSFGGLVTLMQTVFGIIIRPISEYLLTLVMIKRMFFAKTKKEDLFKNDQSKKDSFFVKHRRSKFLDFCKLPE